MGDATSRPPKACGGVSAVRARGSARRGPSRCELEIGFEEGAGAERLAEGLPGHSDRHASSRLRQGGSTWT